MILWTLDSSNLITILYYEVKEKLDQKRPLCCCLKASHAIVYSGEPNTPLVGEAYTDDLDSELHEQVHLSSFLLLKLILVYFGSCFC
jgi:hypothetical protein